MKDPYLRERSTDVKDIAQRLISRLVQDEPEQLTIGEPVVLVADEVTATILAEIPREFLSGVVSLRGDQLPRRHPGPCHGVAAIMGWICPSATSAGAPWSSMATAAISSSNPTR